MTYQAVWNGAVLAETDDVVTVEGNAYFPASSLRSEYVSDGALSTVCPWKGTASYYTITVDGTENENAVWYYPEPKPEAEQIRDRVAFWRGIQVRSAD